MNTIEFKDDDLLMLRAALACAGVKDARYYLNGLHLTSAMVECTDGSRVGRFKVPKGSVLEEGLDVIIPTIKIGPTINSVLLAIDGPISEIHQTDRKGETTLMVVNLIDGKFPDVDRIIPDLSVSTPLRSVALDPLLVTDVIKAAKLGRFSPVNLILNSEGGAHKVELRDLPEFEFHIIGARW